MKRSSLEDIKGIGASKAAALLKHFGKISSIKEATQDELLAVRGISAENAKTIYEYFKGEKK